MIVPYGAIYNEWKAMNEPSLSGNEKNRGRLGVLRTRVERMFPFLSGVLAALLALLIYNAFSSNTQLTQKDVNTAVASALASATPRPAYSAQVYQVIQPSILLIQTEANGSNNQVGRSLGSGVIINDRGDILTSLHVVKDAKRILLTFADGTQSDGVIVS